MSILRLCPSSPAAAPPLEDDDLLSEILLRLPPLPSSLPRASAVCKRWLRLVSDPVFVHRFRRHHRRNPPPLLGFFGHGRDGISFEPTMEPPNRVPSDRFSMLSNSFRLKLIGCRHGLVLIFDSKLKQVLVWDPVAGDKHGIAVPPGFDTNRTPIGATVLRAAGDAHHFQVVLVGSDEQQPTRAFASTYSSETGVWSRLVATMLPSEAFASMPAVLVGNSLYWMLLIRDPRVLLEFDLDRQSLAVIHLPANTGALPKPWDITVMRAEGGGLGLLSMSDFTAQLWKRNFDCDGIASWVLGRTIELDKLLSLNSGQERQLVMILGFAESNNVVFLYTNIGRFMVQLESLQFKRISKPSMGSWYHPFESVYAAGI